MLDRHLLLEDVVEHCGGIALQRIAVTAAAGEAHPEQVAIVHRGEELRGARFLPSVRTHDADVRRCAG